MLVNGIHSTARPQVQNIRLLFLSGNNVTKNFIGTSLQNMAFYRRETDTYRKQKDCDMLNRIVRAITINY